MPYRADGIGYRSTDTSAAAADAVATKAKPLREQAFDLLMAEPAGLTADEIAERLGRHYGSIRPRLTELRDAGRVTDSGLRRSTAMGAMQIVWAAVRPQGPSHA